MSAAFVAINSANNSIAASNAARARAKYLADCQFVMDHGESTASNTVAEKQAYAECVSAIYPPATMDVHSGKAVVAAFLIAALIGAIVGWFRSDYERFESACLGALGGMALLMVGAIIIVAIAFVFS